MPKKPAPPPSSIEGLVTSPQIVSTWQGRPGRTFSYHAPADCRPSSRRVSVMVWEDGQGSTVSTIEGDGRKPGFQRLAEAVLPDGAGEAEIVAAVRDQAATLLSPARPNAEDPERTLAGMLVRAGFVLDDFLGGTAWLRSAEEGVSYFLRAEPEPRAVHPDNGAAFIASIPMSLSDPEAPVQVGVVTDAGGMVYTVAPSLEEALEVVESDRLPRPSGRGEEAVEFSSLFHAPRF